MYKCMPEAECYAKAILPVSVCGIMVELKAGCLPLQVELGRFTLPNTPFKKRLGNLCGREREDQEHFILRCNSLEAMKAKV